MGEEPGDEGEGQQGKRVYGPWPFLGVGKWMYYKGVVEGISQQTRGTE